MIVEVDHQKVTKPKTVADAVHDAAQLGDETILLLLKHQGRIARRGPTGACLNGRPGGGPAERPAGPFHLWGAAAPILRRLARLGALLQIAK